MGAVRAQEVVRNKWRSTISASVWSRGSGLYEISDNYELLERVKIVKVLHVIPSLALVRGGPSVVLRNMARQLAQSGITVDIATTDDNGHDRVAASHGEAISEEGVTYRYFPRQTRFYTFSWPLTHWLAHHVKEYDLVHIHALFSYAAMPAAYWAKRYGVPYIVRPLGVLNRWGMLNRRPWLKTISFRLIDRRIIAGAATVHYTSEQERLEAAELGITQRSIVIPNTVETPTNLSCHPRGCFRSLYPELGDRPIILFLGRIDLKKGLDLLLPAFAEVRKLNPRAALVMAGDGEPEFISKLKQESTRLGISSDTVWTGFLTGEDKWSALADADVFVLPSYSENFGIAVVEAMASRLPVVVSDQVAIHREVSEAKAGLVVSCAPEALAEALTALIANDHLRAEMGINGHRLARTKFSPEGATETLIALYRELCEPISGAVEQAAT